MKQPKSNAAPLNMSPEYRNELKELRGRERTLNRDLRSVARDTAKQRRLLDREAFKVTSSIKKELVAINKRRLILGGRLGK